MADSQVQTDPSPPPSPAPESQPANAAVAPESGSSPTQPNPNPAPNPAVAVDFDGMDGEAYARMREQVLSGQIEQPGEPAAPDKPAETPPADPAAPAQEPEPPATPTDPEPTPADDDTVPIPGKGFRPRLDGLPEVEKEAIALRKQLKSTNQDVPLEECLVRVKAKYALDKPADANANPNASPTDPAAIRARITQLEEDEIKAGTDADTVALARLSKEIRTAERELAAAERAAADASTAQNQEFATAMQSSVKKSRELYPDLKDDNSAISKKWHEIMGRLDANNDPMLTSGEANVPLIVTQMAARELGIAPVDPKAPAPPPAKATPPVPPTPQKQPAQVQLAPGSARSLSPANPTGQLASEMANITTMEDWEAFKLKALAS